MDRPPAGVRAPDLDELLVLANRMDMLARLAGGISHDLANPLAAIAAFGDLIRRDERVPEAVREDAALVVTEAGRAQALARATFDFIRRRPPERHPTSIEPLLRSVLDLSGFAMTARQVRAELAVAAGLPQIAIDRPQVQQALLALLGNAVEALDRGGVVRLSAQAAEGAVVMLVADDGPGVAEGLRDRVFEPRFTTRTGALGLGLPVARAIVEAHGGKLTLETAGGAGATFAVELPSAVGPTAVEEAPRAGERSPGAPSSAPRTILVIDDEEGLRRFLVKAIESAGIRVLAVPDGARAMAVVEGDAQLDAVLCDQRMPGMTGREILEAISTARPELATRLALMSGDIGEPELRRFADERGVRLVPKPFDLAEIREVVVGLVEGRPGGREPDGPPQPRG